MPKTRLSLSLSAVMYICMRELHYFLHGPTSSFVHSEPIQTPPSGPGLICTAAQVFSWDAPSVTPLSWSFTKGVPLLYPQCGTSILFCFCWVKKAVSGWKHVLGSELACHWTYAVIQATLYDGTIHGKRRTWIVIEVQASVSPEKKSAKFQRQSTDGNLINISIAWTRRPQELWKYGRMVPDSGRIYAGLMVSTSIFKQHVRRCMGMWISNGLHHLWCEADQCYVVSEECECKFCGCAAVQKYNFVDLWVG